MNLRRLIRKMRALWTVDPTAKFAARSTPLQLRYDVAEAALNGISYTSTVSQLTIFGPASEVYEVNQELIQIQYDGDGLEITLDGKGVVSFELSFAKGQPLPLGSVAPCQELTVQIYERVLAVGNATSVELFDNFFGASYDRFHFTFGDLCSQYTINGSHFIATHSRDGVSLLRLEIAEATGSLQGIAA